MHVLRFRDSGIHHADTLILNSCAQTKMMHRLHLLIEHIYGGNDGVSDVIINSERYCG